MKNAEKVFAPDPIKSYRPYRLSRSITISMY
jgi:hypothetical protein